MSDQRRYTVNLSADERLIVLAALRQRVETLAKFAIDCEQLLVRQFPSDQPETWSVQRDEARALYERLSSAGDLSNAD